VLVISVDGLRPDLLLRSDTPNMHRLFEGGCYTFWARTVPQGITLPSHTSMLTGVTPRRHGIEWNRDLPLFRPVYPSYPTLFELAHNAGFTTAIATGKSKFATIIKPKMLTWQSIPPPPPDTVPGYEEDEDKQANGAANGAAPTTGAATHPTTAPTTQPKIEDADVARDAARIILEHRPQVMFVHFPGVDTVGHDKGWATPEQILAIAKADKAIGVLLAALGEAGVAGETAIILTADHGGAGKTHGPDDARSLHIPWIVSGPGIRKGVDLTVYPKLQVNTEDTCATACGLLGIRVKDLDGKFVREILEPPAELLRDAGAGK
jgi:arylsulfatase A-like enzyme